ncbi:MAG: septum site-determining protein MinC [Tissierellia bacterium]|nr:septum site-determining protein MinC [Tissierellia bacterium]
MAFKGVNDGVYLEIYGSDMDKIKEELKTKLAKSSGFFQGVNFLGVSGEDLSPEEMLEIHLILKYRYDFDIDLGDDLLDRLYMIYKSKRELESSVVKNSKEGMTKFLYGTLRSGQIVEYNGNIVVVGDVNPGAFLKATGNIIILGTLKGVAHAGFNGDNEAIVAAYNLIPNQLRIADIIVRAPDGDISEYKLPEVARVYDGEIIIEPYLPNK